jgi:hypothetical protein
VQIFFNGARSVTPLREFPDSAMGGNSLTRQIEHHRH